MEKTINRLSKLEAYAKMKSSKGSVFTVTFVKKNGEVRKMNCRLGVTKHLKGGTLAYNPIEKLLLGVFDMQKKAYRMVGLATMFALKIGGVEYDVV